MRDATAERGGLRDDRRNHRLQADALSNAAVNLSVTLRYLVHAEEVLTSKNCWRKRLTRHPVTPHTFPSLPVQVMSLLFLPLFCCCQWMNKAAKSAINGLGLSNPEYPEFDNLTQTPESV